METFAELLSLYTGQAGISDSNLARAVGVSRQTISRWKDGTISRPNKREDVLAVSRKLKLAPDELDRLLLAAGFRPENPGAGPDERMEEAEDDGKELVYRTGKRKVFLTRRMIILIALILGFIIIMTLIDCLNAGSFDPFS